MNDPEVTVTKAATNTNLAAHTKALEAAGIVIKPVLGVPAPLKSIADQVIRSANSVPANVAETAKLLFDEGEAMPWRLLHPRP
jgi:hypothetical protein